MSEPSNKKNLLAGHAPAQIVGGMRVASSHHGKHLNQVDNNNNNDNNNESKSNEANNNSDQSKLSSNDQEQIIEKHQKSDNVVLVNGVEMKLKDIYPTEAVKHMHEKPMPTHDKAQNRPKYPNGPFQPKSHDRAVHF